MVDGVLVGAWNVVLSSFCVACIFSVFFLLHTVSLSHCNSVVVVVVLFFVFVTLRLQILTPILYVPTGIWWFFFAKKKEPQLSKGEAAVAICIGVFPQIVALALGALVLTR